MRRTWTRWFGWAALTLALGGCGSEPAAQRPDTTAALAEYRRSHAAYDRAMERVRSRREPARDKRSRRAAAACLEDWRAGADAQVVGELLPLWEVAVTRGAFARQRPVAEAWIRRLRAIRGLEQSPDLLGRRRAIEAAHARLIELYARPARACGVVREWRARRWQPPMPEAVAHVVRLTAPSRSRQNWVIGVGMPDHDGYCDPVFSTLAPDDSFCG